jgi:hypothetical protein
MTERTWQSIHYFPRTMLVHAQLSDQLKYHAVLHAIEDVSVLTIQYLRTATNEPISPYELF